MIQFSLFKIPVSIHWMFWLLAAFLGGALSISGPQDYPFVLVFMAAATFSIIVHELGHALVGIKLGAPSAQIQLHAMGGLASFPGARFSRKDRILMTAAGPGASIGLAALFFAVAAVTQREAAPETLGPALLSYFVYIVVVINIFWSIINLFPILPMDGGQIMLALLGPGKVRLTCIISFVTLAVLALGLWSYTRSIYNLLIMAFLASHTWQVYQSAGR